jgi:hypothetical protein
MPVLKSRSSFLVLWNRYKKAKVFFRLLCAVKSKKILRYSFSLHLIYINIPLAPSAFAQLARPMTNILVLHFLQRARVVTHVPEANKPIPLGFRSLLIPDNSGPREGLVMRKRLLQNIIVHLFAQIPNEYPIIIYPLITHTPHTLVPIEHSRVSPDLTSSTPHNCLLPIINTRPSIILVLHVRIHPFTLSRIVRGFGVDNSLFNLF